MVDEDLAGRRDWLAAAVWVVAFAGVAFLVFRVEEGSLRTAFVAGGAAALVAGIVLGVTSPARRSKRMLGVSVIASLVLVVLWMREGSLQAMGVASGIGGGVAAIAAIYVFHPRLDYWMLPRETRRKHNEHLLWLAGNVVRAKNDLITSWRRPGARTEALHAMRLVYSSMPFLPPSLIDGDLEASKEDREKVARYKRVAEEVAGPEEDPLEDGRRIYQLNLQMAFGLLMQGVGYELAGHGYVTALWERNLADWVVCARRQYQALKRPFGLAASEEQLLNLLNRLLSLEFQENATKPLQEGDKVRIRAPNKEWGETVRLSADPKIVGRRPDNGVPIWRLEVTDANDDTGMFKVDRRYFEAAPTG